jgi:hypothetical protein
MRIHTTHTRDAALRDLNRITRWLIAGSLVLTAVLSDVAASAFAGKTVKHRDTRGRERARVSAHHSTAPTSTGQLSAPAHAPKATQPSTTESAPAPEPAHESAPAEPARESAPAQEPTHESTPAQEPVHEAAPEPEPSGPAVSGGS